MYNCVAIGFESSWFGPGDEIWAHTPEDQCPVEHLTLAARFYAAFPLLYLDTVASQQAAR